MYRETAEYSSIFYEYVGMADTQGSIKLQSGTDLQVLKKWQQKLEINP